jgi:tetraacyldisaccharide-1-P 4'-kinase
VILDDGLQHHRIKRDLHVVMVNCMSPWGSGALIPRGPLRVPLEEGIKMADLLVLHNGVAPASLAPPVAFFPHLGPRRQLISFAH